MKKLLSILILSILACSLNATPKPVQVLILSGQNNHDWKTGTESIVNALNEANRFKIEVTETFETFPLERLAEFDVIVSNWNLLKQMHNMAVHNWSPEKRETYLNFVKNGKGHVSVHAGSSTFFNWAEYQKLSIATWMAGTHHGPHHEFTVRMDQPEHPITKGLSNFNKWDELWESIHISDPSAQVITSNFSAKKFGGDDKWEPSTLISQFGEGRTAYTSLGHSTQSFESADFKVLFSRIVEWAATNQVTIPAPGTNPTEKAPESVAPAQ